MIIGLDMGGTHVDAVIIDNGEITSSTKKPIHKTDLFQSIWTALQDILPNDRSKIKQINLSTTISTNAIVEKNTSPVAMFIQSGPGLPHHFLACGDENIFLSGYIDHRGQTIKDLDLDEIKNSINHLKHKQMSACGVVTKFSTRNPNHEIDIQNQLQTEFTHITMGHTLSGKLNFPRRVNTTYLNAAVYDTFQSFSQSIKQAMQREGLENIPLYVLKADGGTMNIAGAEKMPVETILSGPAASLMGMNAMLGTKKDAILMDIGGTTTDIFFLAEGVPLFEPLGIQINEYKTLIRSVYSQSIGMGGDSYISEKDGKLMIGPERLGPAMAFNGKHPTPTDAMVVLGHLNQGNKNKAYQGMQNLGKRFNLNAEEMAGKVLHSMAKMIKDKVNELLNTINRQPVYTIQALLDDHKIEPQLIHIIGGPAKVLAPLLKKEFELPCHYPEKYDVANAVGAALSRTTAKISLLADTAQQTLSVPELGIYKKISRNYTLDHAREEALELLVEHGKKIGATEENIETEIIEESSFNMVRGFSTDGCNIRIEAQIKPGLINKIGGLDQYA